MTLKPVSHSQQQHHLHSCNKRAQIFPELLSFLFLRTKQTQREEDGDIIRTLTHTQRDRRSVHCSPLSVLQMDVI